VRGSGTTVGVARKPWSPGTILILPYDLAAVVDPVGLGVAGTGGSMVVKLPSL
jgi:hypothetical protein